MQPAVLIALETPPIGGRTRTATVGPETDTPKPTPFETATSTAAPWTPTRTPSAVLYSPTSPVATATLSSDSSGGTPALTPTKTALPTRTPRPVLEHFLVSRPVAANVTMPWPDPIYLYGTTEKGDYEVHHGEEFENQIGTTLYAVADGTVVTAGSDVQPICGDDGKGVCGEDLLPKGFYGNLVVIRLARPFSGQPVFALYGHMNKINVALGAQVKQGDPIGEIGMSGVAIGPHVHFEVRLGTNDYAHTRNPILWMTPLPGRGSIAGRYTDTKGNLIRGSLVDIYRGDNTFLLETETYGKDRWPAVNPDNDLGENFAMGDLPAGDYIIRIPGQGYAARVTVQEGKLAFVELGGS